MRFAMPTARAAAAPRVAVRHRICLAILALSCAMLMGACGSKSSSSSTPAVKGSVNTAQVALSIKQSILRQRHLVSTVVCPPAVVAEQGKTFECVATTRGTKKPFLTIKTPFVVTIKNNRGGVTYVGK
jgi:hypothetical protein